MRVYYYYRVNHFVFQTLFSSSLDYNEEITNQIAL